MFLLRARARALFRRTHAPTLLRELLAWAHAPLSAARTARTSGAWPWRGAREAGRRRGLGLGPARAARGRAPERGAASTPSTSTPTQDDAARRRPPAPAATRPRGARPRPSTHSTVDEEPALAPAPPPPAVAPAELMTRVRGRAGGATAGQAPRAHDQYSRPGLHTDGKSLIKQLQGDDSGQRTLYWHYPHYHGSGWKPGASIRDSDWKLVEFYHYDKFELYNLATDPR